MKLDDLKKANEMAGVAITGLDLIARLTSNTSDDKAVDVVSAVRAVITTILGGLAGGADPKDIETALASRRDQLHADRAAADAALHRRFDPAP